MKLAVTSRRIVLLTILSATIGNRLTTTLEVLRALNPADLAKLMRAPAFRVAGLVEGEWFI